MNILYRLYLRFRYGAPTTANPLPYAAHFQEKLAQTAQRAAETHQALVAAHNASMNEHAVEIVRNAEAALQHAHEIAEQIRSTRITIQ